MAGSRYNKHKGIINLDVIINEARDVVNKKMINTALLVHGALRSPPPTGTPIDTRWASTNWTLSVDKPLDDPVGSKENIVTTAVGVVEALQFDIEKNNTIYIQNNVPYIAALNRGHSKQSPAGFVEAAIDEAMLANGLLEV